MIILIIYFIVVLGVLFFFLQRDIDRGLDVRDISQMFIASIFWFFIIPLILVVRLYYYIKERIKEHKPYVDPWEEVPNYRTRTMGMDIGLERPKKIKHFKFGR